MCYSGVSFPVLIDYLIFYSEMKVQDRFLPCGTIQLILGSGSSSFAAPPSASTHLLLGHQGHFQAVLHPRGRILLPSFHYCVLEQLGTLPLLVATGCVGSCTGFSSYRAQFSNRMELRSPRLRLLLADYLMSLLMLSLWSEKCRLRV